MGEREGQGCQILVGPLWGCMPARPQAHPAPHTHQHPFPPPASLTQQDAKSGRHIPSHPPPPIHLFPRSRVEVAGPLDVWQEGCPSPPHPLSPKSPALRPRRGTDTRDGAQNTKEVLPSCPRAEAGGRPSDGGVKGSAHPPERSFPSPPLPPPRSLRVCLFCLSKEFTEREGRASSGGRTAARCRWSVGRRRMRRPPGRSGQTRKCTKKG